MTQHIAYFRVSTADQSVTSQRLKLLKDTAREAFDREYADEGVSGATPAAQRPEFAKLVDFIREGDVLYVAAVDRLGRDALDVQATVRALLLKGVTIQVLGLGTISRGVGELIMAVLAQVADMERMRIAERTAAGRDAARASLAATGKTHKGRASLGRPHEKNPEEVRQWRKDTGSSLSQTADHFGLSLSTVKRYCPPTAPEVAPSKGC